jgi:hypothetical protein
MKILEGLLMGGSMAIITALWVATMVCEWIERKDDESE